MQNGSLTTEEVAQLLKVSKLTVYDLIKKGELPSYRVGRQIRIERSALEAYKNQGTVSQPESKQTTVHHQQGRSIIISGQDNCLDILAKHIEAFNIEYRSLRSYSGSLDGLIAMYQGKADIVSTHLFDGETSTYNIPYIRKILVSKSFIVIHLLQRNAGLFVAKNNPKEISSWKDLDNPEITIINREAGAGARVLLDEQLRLHQISREKINGYHNEVTSHIDVASAIANGLADAGVGTEHAAKMANIDFLSMIEESYDLVIEKSKQNRELIQILLQITQKESFIDSLKSLGYNTVHTGKILYEQ
ncbi:helix-turn-helix transcriptional regulator [Pseudogracilibacillus sp. SO30301A]|uniref:helix-turn-helix transcriptional regulator n=1 Tax=Pseudogracilibacillus sp. SO30301A TaxID=3098291 RepID=UPI00300DCAA9